MADASPRIGRGSERSAVGGVLCLMVFPLPRRRATGEWGTFFRVGCIAFFLASLVEAAVATLGEGPVEQTKHLYFANLLFDVHFLLGLCGLGAAVAEPLRRSQTEGGFSASQSAMDASSGSVSSMVG